MDDIEIRLQCVKLATANGLWTSDKWGDIYNFVTGGIGCNDPAHERQRAMREKRIRGDY